MDVILLQDVEHVGLKGDVVDVKRGYARNYLLPRRLADVATPGALAQAQNVQAQRARQEARTAEQAQEIAAVLAETVLRFDVKAGPTGSLFGSVTATDVAEELWRARKVRVDRRKLEMDSIKRIGRYTITAQLFDGVSAGVRAEVVPEGGELPPEEELAAMEAAEAEAAAAEAEARATNEAALEELLADEEAEEEDVAESRAEVEAEAEAETETFEASERSERSEAEAES
jgi:large subunit ribosomal protein L9